MAEKYNIDLLKVKQEEIYNFSVSNPFFEEFEESTLKEGDIEVVVNVERASSNTFPTVIESKGTVKTLCDRCLNEIDYPVESRLDFVIKLSEQAKDDEDEIVYVAAQEAVFHAKQHIYDSIYLSLPIRKVCETAINKTNCDEKVIEKLEGKNNDETGIDPRWNKLKDLL